MNRIWAPVSRTAATSRASRGAWTFALLGRRGRQLKHRGQHLALPQLRGKSRSGYRPWVPCVRRCSAERQKRAGWPRSAGQARSAAARPAAHGAWPRPVARRYHAPARDAAAGRDGQDRPAAVRAARARRADASAWRSRSATGRAQTETRCPRGRSRRPRRAAGACASRCAAPAGGGARGSRRRSAPRSSARRGPATPCRPRSRSTPRRCSSQSRLVISDGRTRHRIRVERHVRCARDARGNIDRLVPVRYRSYPARPGLAVSLRGPSRVQPGTTASVRRTRAQPPPRPRSAALLAVGRHAPRPRAHEAHPRAAAWPHAHLQLHRQGAAQRRNRQVGSTPRGRFCVGVGANAPGARAEGARVCSRVRAATARPPAVTG